MPLCADSGILATSLSESTPNALGTPGFLFHHRRRSANRPRGYVAGREDGSGSSRQTSPTTGSRVRRDDHQMVGDSEREGRYLARPR